VPDRNSSDERPEASDSRPGWGELVEVQLGLLLSRRQGCGVVPVSLGPISADIERVKTLREVLPTCHTRRMHMTEIFASTVAVSIPVLMLAGAVELQSFGNAVTKRVSDVNMKGVAELSKFFKEMTKSAKDEVDYDLKSLLLLFKAFGLYFKVLKLRFGPVIALILPSVWFVTLVLAAVAEVYCLVYLAGVNVQFVVPLLSIVAVGALMTLLIITPAVRTLIMARHIGNQRFVAMMIENSGFDTVRRSVSEFISSWVKANEMTPEEGQEMIDEFDSRMKKYMNKYMPPDLLAEDFRTDTLRQGRYRAKAPIVYRTLPPRRRLPRWAVQARFAKERADQEY
jgi:hypothetical protein